MPDNQVIRQWVDALRSGDYGQAQGNLCLDGKYCCLGVLCELHRQEFGGKWVNAKYLGMDSYLPEPVWSWAGLGSISPTVQDPSGGRLRPTLIDLNDGAWSANHRYSFTEIADVIEREWLR